MEVSSSYSGNTMSLFFMYVVHIRKYYGGEKIDLETVTDLLCFWPPEYNKVVSGMSAYSYAFAPC
jgi:hypothetical protein